MRVARLQAPLPRVTYPLPFSSAQVHVLGMPLGEVYARRHAIKRLRARLNERAVVQVTAWAEEAMVAEAG